MTKPYHKYLRGGLMCAAFFATASLSHLTAEVYWVNPAHPSADDTNPGTVDAPFVSVSRGLSEAGPGNTLMLADGTYSTPLLLTAGGTSSEPFIIEAENTGGATIEAPAPVLAGTAENAVGSVEYVTLRGLVFTGATQQNHKAAVIPSTGWTLENIRIENSYAGIRIDAGSGTLTDIKLDGVLVQDCLNTGVLALTDTWSDGKINNLTVTSTLVRRCNTAYFGAGSFGGGMVFYHASGLVVSNNTVYDNNGPGIWVAESCINFEVQKNTVFANHANRSVMAPGIQISGSSNGSVDDNLIYSNTGAGIALLESHDVTATGNTLIDNQTAVTLRNLYLYSDSASAYSVPNDTKLRNLTVENNKMMAWRESAWASWPHSLIRVTDLENRSISGQNNHFDPDESSTVLSLLADILGTPPASYAPVTIDNLSTLASSTPLGQGATEVTIAIPQGTILFPTVHGLDSQVDEEGEADSVLLNIQQAPDSGEFTLPIQNARPSSESAVLEIRDLRDWQPVYLVFSSEAAANTWLTAWPNARWIPGYAEVTNPTIPPPSVTYVSESGSEPFSLWLGSDKGDLAEAGSTTLSLVAERTDSTAEWTIPWKTNGPAAMNGDYTVTPASLTFQSGSTTQELQIQAVDDNIVEGIETGELGLRAGSGYVLRPPAVWAVTITDQPFDAWRLKHFSLTAGEATPAYADDEMDPDNDGRSNLEEFITGTNPTQKDAGLSLSQEGESPIVTWRVPMDTGRVQWHTQTSSNLIVWDTPSPNINFQMVADGSAYEYQASFSDAALQTGERFFRLQYTRQSLE